MDIINFISKTPNSSIYEVECRFRRVHVDSIREFALLSGYKHVFKKSTAYLYEENYRIEVFTNSDGSEKVESIRKQPIKHKFFNVNGVNCKIAISTEIEENPTKIRSLPVRLVRHKSRDSYYNSNFSIDITRIGKGSDTNVEYEIDIEMINRTKFSAFVNLIQKVTSLSMFNPKPILQKYKTYNIKMNNAVSLKKEYLLDEFSPQYIQKVTVSPKLNGTRYFMYTTDNKSYLINTRHCLPYTLFSTEPKIPNETVLDGEMYKHAFNVFDCLIMENIDYRNRMRIERVSKLSKVPDLKQYDYSITNYKQTILDYETKFKNEDTDGYLIIEWNSVYNTDKKFKYKPTRMLTIDFSVKPVLNPNGLTDYILISMSDNGLTQFRGTSKYPFEGVLRKVTPEDRMLLDRHRNGVFEFEWFCDNFRPIKHRTDKKKPNGIETAESVWDDINKPITFQELLKMMDYRDSTTFKQFDENRSKVISNPKNYLLTNINKLSRLYSDTNVESIPIHIPVECEPIGREMFDQTIVSTDTPDKNIDTVDDSLIKSMDNLKLTSTINDSVSTYVSSIIKRIATEYNISEQELIELFIKSTQETDTKYGKPHDKLLNILKTLTI